jgi:glycosyltransferase involved in cell wall biosynthesis
MTFPKISVITPSYNQGKFIQETIESVLEQCYPNLEYIIIDGGSTDNSVDIIKKYQDKIQYWVSEKDRGQSDAINKGFKKSTGDIVCWLNSDDILLPNSLHTVASIFQENKDLDLLNGNTVIIDKNSNILTGLFILKQKKWYARHGIYYVNQPAMFWKRNIFKTIGFIKEDYHASMDREFLIRVFEHGFRIGQTQEMLAGFRVHPTAKSQGNSTNWFIRDKAEMYKLYNGRYKQEPDNLKLVYGIEKLLKGVYWKKWFFTKKWKGKSVSEFKQSINN